MRTPTSPSTSPDVPSGLTAKPPAKLAYTFELCAYDGAASSASAAAMNKVFMKDLLEQDVVASRWLDGRGVNEL